MHSYQIHNINANENYLHTFNIYKFAITSWNWHWKFEVNKDNGCVHMRMNHVPKDVLDRDPKRDWDCDLNCVRSHVLQTPSQSRSGSARCKVIFCSHRAVRADWPMHGFSAHFQNAHARITFRKSFAFTWPRIRLSMRSTIQNALFFGDLKCISKAWFETALRSQGLKSGKGRITFRNIFRNVIRSHVNKPNDIEHACDLYY